MSDDLKFKCEITNTPNGIITPTKFRDISGEKKENKTMKRQDLIDISNALTRLEEYKKHVQNCNCTPIVECQTIRCQQKFVDEYDDNKLYYDKTHYDKWENNYYGLNIKHDMYDLSDKKKAFENFKKIPNNARLPTNFPPKYNNYEYEVNYELLKYPYDPFTGKPSNGIQAYVYQYIKDRDYKISASTKSWKACQKINGDYPILTCEKVSCQVTTCQLVLCQRNTACQTCQSVLPCQVCQTCETQCKCQSCQICQNHNMYNNCCQQVTCQSQCSCQTCQDCENISCQAYITDGKDLPS